MLVYSMWAYTCMYWHMLRLHVLYVSTMYAPVLEFKHTRSVTHTHALEHACFHTFLL